MAFITYFIGITYLFKMIWLIHTSAQETQ